MSTRSPEDAVRPELAYYYPAPYWPAGPTSDWAKTLLLFFDGVATLVPRGLRQAALDADPAIAGAMVDAGLLRMIDPGVLWSGVESDDYYFLEKTIFEYSSRELQALDLGPFGPDPLTNVLFDSKLSYSLLLLLMGQGLARRLGRDEFFEWRFEVHPIVWNLVLTGIAQHLARRRDLDAQFCPVTDDPTCREIVAEHLWSRRATVVMADLRVVTIDLASVPLDEVLDFRRQYGAEFRAYRRGLNRYVMDLSQATEEERQVLEHDRTEELADWQSDLRSRSHVLGTGAPFLLGMIGAVLQVGGDPLGAAGSAVNAASSLGRPTGPMSEFSYLFRAADQWRDRP